MHPGRACSITPQVITAPTRSIKAPQLKFCGLPRPGCGAILGPRLTFGVPPLGGSSSAPAENRPKAALPTTAPTCPHTPRPRANAFDLKEPRKTWRGGAATRRRFKHGAGRGGGRAWARVSFLTFSRFFFLPCVIFVICFLCRYLSVAGFPKNEAERDAAGARWRAAERLSGARSQGLRAGSLGRRHHGDSQRGRYAQA